MSCHSDRAIAGVYQNVCAAVGSCGVLAGPIVGTYRALSTVADLALGRLPLAV